MISLIAAIGKNNELGKGNTLLWHMPADMNYFRGKTCGHSIIMGRKTFESLKGPLPTRKNIVITRDKSYLRHGVDVVNSLEEALQKVKGEDEVFVIGGAEIYKQAIPLADRLYITHIDAENKNADAFFPEVIPVAWNEVFHEEYKKDSENPFDYTFSIYDKFI